MNLQILSPFFIRPSVVLDGLRELKDVNISTRFLLTKTGFHHCVMATEYQAQKQLLRVILDR